MQRLSRPKKQAVRQPATFRGASNHYVLDPMFHDKWQKEKNEWRINPPSLLPSNRYSNVRGIFVFKRLQTFFFCYGYQTLSSLLRLSSLFQTKNQAILGTFERFGFISQFICPLFSGISRHLIYVNDYFTILYLQAIFLKHTFSSRLIWLWQRTSMKRNSTMLELLSV